MISIEMKAAFDLLQVSLVISMISVAAWSPTRAASHCHRFAKHGLFFDGSRRSSGFLSPCGRFSFRLYSGSNENEKKRVVFLGTPDVAATTLSSIYEDSTKDGSIYDLVAVVTQPPKKRGRKKDKLEPSPVAVAAEELGIPAMWPEKVGLRFASVLFDGFETLTFRKLVVVIQGKQQRILR